MPISTVKVPAAFEPLFESAEAFVRQYFGSRRESPESGIISIGGERYILVRAKSMSVHFFEYVKTLYPGLDEAEGSKAAGSILFDVAHALGRADAKAFHEAMKVSDPIAKLSSGPVHFAHTGWAFVDIFEESRPSPDENYYLVYDHPQSFEADSWLASDKRPGLPVCFMNAGYSSGWCEVSFSVDLVAKEMLCRAKGDPFCRFIMAHPGRVDGFVQEYRRSHPDLFAKA